MSDVAGHWAEASIRIAVDEGIVTGYPDGTFRPEGAVTRAEFAVMLARAMGIDANAPWNAVPSGDEEWPNWAGGFISALRERGIVNGYSNGRFEPGLTLSRSEIAAILARALSLPTEAGTTTTFADDADIPAWAKPYVSSAVKAGIVQGRGDNRFVPEGAATRAEAVALIVRLLARL